MTRTLPDGLEKYSETPVFTSATVPEKLMQLHDTKPGVWGKLIVMSGALDFYLPGPPEESRNIKAGGYEIIEPTAPHKVALCEGASFKVEFYQNAGRSFAAKRMKKQNT